MTPLDLIESWLVKQELLDRIMFVVINDSLEVRCVASCCRGIKKFVDSKLYLTFRCTWVVVVQYYCDGEVRKRLKNRACKC